MRLRGFTLNALPVPMLAQDSFQKMSKRTFVEGEDMLCLRRFRIEIVFSVKPSKIMSFDDLFWKRKFNAQIYRTSDKFDREIEDYRFGVDALYEAEKIKGEIRKWEHDVWNY